MKVVAICALAGALLGSGVAYTQVVTAEKNDAAPTKYRGKFAAQFKAADKDGDGALSKAEAQAAGMQRIVDNFERIDANGDGKVTHEEIRAMIHSRVTS